MRRRPISSAYSSSSALARARIASGLTQRELADRAGLSVFTVHRAETGERRPSYRTADKISAILGAEVKDFWPTLERAVKAGRLLDTVIPAETAFTPVAKAKRRSRLGYERPEGGSRAEHRHRPPICCGKAWCRCVDLSKPETFRSFGDPRLIEFAVGGVNA